MASSRVCNACRKHREGRDLKPKPLTKLPLEVTAQDFKRRTLGLYLCEDCDDQTLDLAIKAHEQRTKKPR